MSFWSLQIQRKFYIYFLICGLPDDINNIATFTKQSMNYIQRPIMYVHFYVQT